MVLTLLNTSVIVLPVRVEIGVGWFRKQFDSIEADIIQINVCAGGITKFPTSGHLLYGFFGQEHFEKSSGKIIEQHSESGGHTCRDLEKLIRKKRTRRS